MRKIIIILLLACPLLAGADDPVKLEPFDDLSECNGDNPNQKKVKLFFSEQNKEYEYHAYAFCNNCSLLLYCSKEFLRFKDNKASFNIMKNYKRTVKECTDADIDIANPKDFSEGRELCDQVMAKYIGDMEKEFENDSKNKKKKKGR